MSADPGQFRPYLRDLYRLRTLAGERPIRVVDALAQARDCGRSAYSAGVPIDSFVEEVARIVPEAGFLLLEFPADIVEAAVDSYLTAFDAERHVLRTR